jgi:hypothetical protein
MAMAWSLRGARSPVDQRRGSAVVPGRTPRGRRRAPHLPAARESAGAVADARERTALLAFIVEQTVHVLLDLRALRA